MTKLLGSCLAIALLFMQYQLWLMPGGIRSAMTLRTDIQQIEQQNQVFIHANQALMSGIGHLKAGNHAVESQARNELGMIKKGEVFYQVVDG